MAKTKEITVEDKLRALYDLQIIDSRLDELTNVRGELPMEVEDLENEIIGLEKREEKLNDEIASLEREIKDKKEANKNSEALIKKYKKQQDNVRNNREFEALSKEVEYQELEIQLAEKRIKEYSAKIEHKKEMLTELSEKIKSYKEHLDHKKSELNSIIKETLEEEEFLSKKSEEYSSKLDDRLLRSYRRIRDNSPNGLAVVSIERGAVNGSFFTIPPQKIIEISNRKKVMTDEHSGKILVDEELAHEEQEKMQKVLKK